MIRLSRDAMRNSLGGLEFASGIPGTVGGAVFMNAGAYGEDMSKIVESVKVINSDLEIVTLSNKEMNYSYRTSILQDHLDYVCISATLKLYPADKDELERIMNERRETRMNTQPLNYPSAGSVFRNPEGDFAGRIIEEDLKFKGKQIGGAKISEKHANFIINVDNATGTDIRELIKLIKEKVKEKDDIDLIVEQEFIDWE